MDGTKQEFDGFTFDRAGRKTPRRVKNTSKGNLISIELSYEQAAKLVAQIVILMQERISHFQEEETDLQE